MTKLNRDKAQPAGIKLLFAALLSSVALVTGGCSGGGERDENDGTLLNTITLPTDVVLNLACEDVGVWPENCVLDDPENPFATTPISEFDVNNPNDPFNKLELAARIPEGPSGAKARFYLWATALARRPSGENQYFTALALHELFDANSNVLNQDELVREQAKKAYRSVLENFFGGVAVRTCRVVDGCDPPSNFFIQLNERVADNLYRTDATGWRRLVPGDPRFAIELLIDWGFTYDPCTDLPACTNGVVSVGEF
ncbi:MAG: hypothetical protein QNJ05_14540 [Woeseiaceae bacterium]|nr:hypothetical protein [Woeseiaceae bacterium]